MCNVRNGTALILLSLLLFPAAPHAKEPAVLPPPVLLANEFRAGIDPSKYLVSEKYDGVRAIWDGALLRFRSGRIVTAPDWFLERLPQEPVDGELWVGRGKFEELSGIVRKERPSDEEWQKIKYMIFELPGAPGTFADRVDRIREIVAATKFRQLVAVEQFRISDRSELKRKLDQVVRAGGEGLMLHLAAAEYVTGRSDVLLKLKPLQDTEAIVSEHVAGRGKYRGMLGAVRVQRPDGKQFLIGTGFSDNVRKNPPALGTTITYTYRGLTRTGLPRFPSYLRIREDF